MKLTRKIHPNQDSSIIFTRNIGEDADWSFIEKIAAEFIKSVNSLLNSEGGNYTNPGDINNAKTFIELIKSNPCPEDLHEIKLSERVPNMWLNAVVASISEISLMEYIVKKDSDGTKPIRGAITLNYRTVDQNNLDGEGHPASIIKKVRVTGILPVFLIQAIREYYEHMLPQVLVAMPSVGTLAAATPVNKEKQSRNDFPLVSDEQLMERFKKLPHDQQVIMSDLLIQFLTGAVITLNDKLMDAMSKKKG